MVTGNPGGQRMLLKRKYLRCFASRSLGNDNLPRVVRHLVDLGETRETLFRWAVEANHRPAYVRSVLSRVLCALGRRVRSKGAGRKASPEALALLSYAEVRHGDRALSVLRAAYRVAKAKVSNALTSAAYCGTTITAEAVFEVGATFQAGAAGNGTIDNDCNGLPAMEQDVPIAGASASCLAGHDIFGLQGQPGRPGRVPRFLR